MVPQHSSFGNPALLAAFSATLLNMAERDRKGMAGSAAAASQERKGMEVFVFCLAAVLNNGINILEREGRWGSPFICVCG